MNSEQIESLKISLQETFPKLCLSKDASFDMQNLIKNVTHDIKVWLIGSLYNTILENGQDLIDIFMNHKYANYILSAIFENNMSHQ